MEENQANKNFFKFALALGILISIIVIYAIIVFNMNPPKEKIEHSGTYKPENATIDYKPVECFIEKEGKVFYNTSCDK